MTTDVLEGRRARNNDRMLALSRFCALVLAAPAIAVGLLVGLLVRSPLLGGVAMLLLGAALAAWMFTAMRGFGARYLQALDGRPAEGDTFARLHNLTEGLCVANGLNKPTLYVIDEPTPNICTVVTGGGDSPQAAVIATDGLVNGLSRIELEGVLAQQLGHLRDGDTALSTFAASLVTLPLLGGVLLPRVRTALDADLETVGDLAGVRMTRYPPGLASALEKLAGGSTVVPSAPPLTAHLWLADPLPPPADGAHSAEPLVPHPPLDERVAVLREL